MACKLGSVSGLWGHYVVIGCGVAAVEGCRMLGSQPKISEDWFGASGLG